MNIGYELDNIYQGDCTQLMSKLPTDSIDVVVTSPPYWNQKEYSHWETYQAYIDSVGRWVKEVARILKPGRHCFWVVPDKLPWPPKDNGTQERLYHPIYADTKRLAGEFGLIPKFPIIWKKPHGSQKMFGSYPYPPTIIHTPMTERICVWRKPGKHSGSLLKDESKITRDQWVHWAQDLWLIQPETHSKHPAPFPEDIVERILTLWSFVGDVVLDPFMGSGTTAVVARRLKRRWLGFELSPQYVEMTKLRLSVFQEVLF